MEEWQMQYIEKNLLDLIKNMDCNIVLLSNIRHFDIVLSYEANNLIKLPDKLESSNQLIEILRTRTKGYKVLTRALFQSKQTLAFEILVKGLQQRGIEHPLHYCNIDHTKAISYYGSPNIPELAFKEIPTLEFKFLNEKVTLKQLWGHKNSTELQKLLTEIDLGAMSDIIRNRDSPITKNELPKFPPYYVPRSLNIPNRLDPLVFKENLTDIFVFKELERSDLAMLADPYGTDTSLGQLGCFSGIRFIKLDSPEDFEILGKQYKGNTHLISCQPGKYFWEQTIGSTKYLSQYLHSESIINENDLTKALLKDDNSSPVCISNLPGMGKTIFLQKLADNLLNYSKNVVWVSFKELLGSTPMHANVSLQSLLNSIADKISFNAFGKTIVHKILKNQHTRIYLFLDGLDELPGNQINKGIQIFNCIVENCKNIKLIVSTRLSRRDVVEETLGTISYSLCPFTETDQIEFLINYWITQEIVPHQAREFAQKSLNSLQCTESDLIRDIASIPMQCSIFAEICLGKLKRGQEEHLRKLSLPKSMRVLDLYHGIVEFKIADAKSRNEFKCSIKRVLNCLFTDSNFRLEIVDTLTVLAFNEIFPWLSTEFLSWRSPVHEDLKLLAFRIGLIKSAEEPQFVHRTYAEYFVARFISVLIYDKVLLTKINVKSTPVTRLILGNFKNILKVVEIDDILVPGGIFPHNTTSIYTFVHGGIAYFINAFSEKFSQGIDEHGYQKRLKQISGGLRSKDLLPKITASVKSNFRFLFELCFDLYRTQANDLKLFPWSSLILSATKHCSDIILNYLINSTDHNETFCQSGNKVSISPIHVAVYVGDFTKFDLLWKANKFAEHNQMYLLHLCLANSIDNTKEVISDKKQIIKYLVRTKRNILDERLSCHNSTCLLQECIHPDLIKIVIQEGANVNDISYNKDTLLHMALKKQGGKSSLNLNSLKEILNFLKDYNFNVINCANSANETPLHLAIKHISDLDREAIQAFLNCDANLNIPDGNGDNLIFLAVRYNFSTDFVQYLIESGSDFTIRNAKRKSILHVAAKHSSYKLVDFLLNATQLSPNLIDMFGDNVLHISIKTNKPDSTKLQRRLIEAGALLDSKNEKGNIPLVEGYRSGIGLSIKEEILHLFQEKGLVINSKLASKCITGMLLNSNLTRDDLQKHLSFHLKYMISLGGDFQCNDGTSPYLQDAVRQNIAIIYDKNPKIIDICAHSADMEKSMFDTSKTKINRNTFIETLLKLRVPIAKLCHVLLDGENIAAFLFIRKALRSCTSEIIRFKDVPTGLENLNMNNNLVIKTTNTNVCVDRIRESVGGNILVYRHHARNSYKTRADIVIIKVGEDESLLSSIDKYFRYANKVIFVTTNNVAKTSIGNISRDIVKWEDFTSCHQDNMIRKVQNVSADVIRKFKPEHYAALPESLLLNLASKTCMSDYVFRALIAISHKELFAQSSPKLYSKLFEIAIETAFPELWSSKLKCSQIFANELTLFTQERIIVEDSSMNTKYKFSNKLDAHYVLGNDIALRCYNDRGIHKMLTDVIFSSETFSIYFYDKTNKKFALRASKFLHADIVYFYSLNSNNIHSLHEILMNREQEFILACIHSNLECILKSLTSEHLTLVACCDAVLLSISFCSVATLKWITSVYLKPNISKLNQLGLEGTANLVPLQLAVRRGNYAVVDYVLNTFYSKSNFVSKDISFLLKYCVNNTYSNDRNEIEERKEIIHLLHDKFVYYGYDQKNYFKRILVETNSVHIELMKFLIDAGADVNELDNRLSTILHRTPSYFNEADYLELTKFLIYRNLGHLFQVRNLDDKSPIRCALLELKKKSENSDEDDICQVMKLINKRAGIPYNLINRDGETILHNATFARRSEKVIQTIRKLGNLVRN